MTRNIESHPNYFARIDGVLYLAIILMGAFAEGFIGDRLIVSSDPAATARNIMASESLWNIGAAANLLIVVLGVPSQLIEYLLFKPAGKRLAQLGLLFVLMSLAVETVSKFFLFAVLAPLDNAPYLTAFDTGQLQGLAYLAVKAHNVGFSVALIFFGCGCLVNGLLIFKSRYLPRTVGLLLQLAGACYLVASFASLFAPALYNVLAPAILIPPLIGESALCLWLLFRGVNLVEWRNRVELN